MRLLTLTTTAWTIDAKGNWRQVARILTKDETGWHDDAARKPKGQTNEQRTR